MRNFPVYLVFCSGTSFFAYDFRDTPSAASPSLADTPGTYNY